ncbi:DUF6809 family protein [Agathobaculum sp.]|uniref:DUF6809 family protein n=1 Tax=Agathobaculum sp. TaxID=2048138 RepID=UPI002A83D4C2|nr:DUF6809 family protein [Agathobaculum sp.]MDY3617812.1 hypothetical protein [Agathobaculum sp.]
MYMTDNIAAECFQSITESAESEKTYRRMLKMLNKKQRRLFIRFYDEMTDLIDLTAQDNYVRGICMGLSFAERYCYVPK